MNWPAHFFIGMAVGLALAILLNTGIPVAVQLTFICALSALVPDIDHHDSKIRQFGNYAALAAAILFSILMNCNSVLCVINSWHYITIFSLAIFGAYQLFIIFAMPSHRGFVHSLTAAAVYAIIMFLLWGMQFALFGLAGYLSHLLADKEIKIV